MIEVEAVPFHKLAEVDLADRAMKTLVRHYPGYQWRIGIDEEGGVMYILNADVNMFILGMPNYGYTLHLKRVYSDPDLKCVMRAGGQILESAGINRGWNKNEIVKKIDDINVPVVM